MGKETNRRLLLFTRQSLDVFFGPGDACYLAAQLFGFGESLPSLVACLLLPRLLLPLDLQRGKERERGYTQQDEIGAADHRAGLERPSHQLRARKQHGDGDQHTQCDEQVLKAEHVIQEKASIRKKKLRLTQGV